MSLAVLKQPYTQYKHTALEYQIGRMDSIIPSLLLQHHFGASYQEVQTESNDSALSNNFQRMGSQPA